MKKPTKEKLKKLREDEKWVDKIPKRGRFVIWGKRWKK